jgi:hypothetical protein
MQENLCLTKHQIIDHPHIPFTGFLSDRGDKTWIEKPDLSLTQAMSGDAMVGGTVITGPIAVPVSPVTINPIAALLVAHFLDDSSGTEDTHNAGFALYPNQPSLAGNGSVTIFTGINSPLKPEKGSKKQGGNSLEGGTSGWERKNQKSLEIETQSTGSS